MARRGKKAEWSLIFLFLFGTFIFPVSVKKNINVTLHEKRVQDLSSSGLILAFHCKLSNASSQAYYLTKYDYRAVVNQTEYVRLQTALELPIKIEAEGEMLISLPLKITYSLLFQAVPGVEASDKIPCTLTGLMFFADERKREEKIPFAFSGEFPVYADPEINFRSLQVKDLTLGGAEIVLEINMKNKNNFNLSAERINYQLDLAGKRVAKGAITGENVIAGQGEKVFAIPLLLDFFEIGKDLYQSLQQPAVECVLSGEADVATEWGKVRVPFSKLEKLSVSRSLPLSSATFSQ